MNVIFEIYYLVFAIFAALLITELMGALVLLLFWNQAKTTVLEYIVPIWEVTGTFAALTVVVGDFAYPTLLVPIALIFAPLLTIFLIFFVARNASLAFAEYLVKRKWLDTTKLYRVYALSTVILGLTVLVLLSALVSGAGVNYAEETFSLGGWISSSGSVLFVVGTLVVAVGVAPVFFALEHMKKIVLPLTAVGIGLSVFAYYLYSPSFVPILMVIPVVLTLLVGALFAASKRTAVLVSNKAVFIAVLSVIIFSLQFLIYPSALGGAVRVDSVTTSGLMATGLLIVTAVGGTLLAIMIAFYMRIVRRIKNPKT